MIDVNSIAKIIINKKIAGDIYNIYPKTSTDNIVYTSEKSVKDIINDIEKEIEEIKNNQNKEGE